MFYRQERVGRAGRTFRMIKFRSMVVDADQQVAQLVAANEGAGPLFKMKRDPRITRIGGVLRRFSLDELPQLFNVLGGSMSLVGPRPPLPARGRPPTPRTRCASSCVRPGLTGLWQVSGRSRPHLGGVGPPRPALRRELVAALDVSILWKTVGAVFRGRGAY